jgi:thiosulfate dehydrogenase (quinone) large subunit
MSGRPPPAILVVAGDSWSLDTEKGGGSAMASEASGRSTNAPVYIEEPRFSKWLFGSSAAAWIWLVARLWLGWEWLQAGWSKVFGGNITWKFWDWGNSAYSLTGDGNIGWVRSGTVVAEDGQQRTLQVGDAVAGFARGALERGTAGDHPDIAYSWYVNWLEWLRDSGHTFFGPLVAVGEVVIGIALILGLFTGIMAFLGAILNFSFVFAGSAGVNPAMILVSGLLILAWRNAGWYGLDRFVLPKLGTPWHRGELFDRRGGEVRTT